jgi:hypothetical protein
MSRSNMQDFLKHLAGHLGGDEKTLSDEAIRGFLRALEDVRVQDVPCSQVFSRLDEYVEKELNGEDAARLMPLLREHLDLCQDCCDEYETLLAAVEKSSKAPLQGSA